MNPRAWLPRLLPMLRWWHLVTRENLPRDLLAGLVGALIVLPQGIAFATLAGLPPEYGLYAAMVPTAVAALFGSSLHTVSGPTNAISLMTFASLAPLAIPGSAEYVRLAGTLAAVGWAVEAGARLVRAHDVAETRDFLTVLDAIAGRAEVPADLRIDEAIRREAPAEAPADG